MIEGRNYIDLTKSSSGGGGGASSYIDLSDKPKMNGTTIVGNKTSSDYGLQDALVSGTNIKTINSTSLLGSGDITATEDVQINGTSIVSSGVANIPIATSNATGVVKSDANNGIGATSSGSLFINYANDSEINSRNSRKAITPTNLDYAVRSVKPACTTITASDTTATITANSTYSHKPTTSATYTLATPADTSTVYNGFILMLDTTNSASIAFSTDGSPSTSITISGNPTIQTGKRYTVTGQYSPINSSWELFIISYETT